MLRSLSAAAAVLGAVALLSGRSKEKPLVLPSNVVTATVGVGAIYGGGVPRDRLNFDISTVYIDVMEIEWCHRRGRPTPAPSTPST